MEAGKKISVAVLAMYFLFAVSAAEAELTCKSENFKNGTIKRPTPANPLIQEITISCGSQNTAQTIPTASAAHTSQERMPTFNWDKLIDALVKILSSLAWPIAAVYIAFFFKKELAALLARLKKGKWGAAEFEFENYVREVEAETEIPRTPESENVTPSVAARASTDPRGAIVSAWIEVEDALFSLVRNWQLSDPVSSAKQIRSTVWAIRAVQKAQALDPNWIALFYDLRAMRNEAAHSPDFSPPPDAVLKYVQLAKELTSAMRDATPFRRHPDEE